MKAKVAHKAVRHAMPAKKRTHKRVRPAPPAKKPAAKPVAVEVAETTFEAPVEIVFTEPEVVEVVEVFDSDVPVDLDEL